ncbi:Gfo/Idh/MocA family oxidoreductase [Martelella mediterranea]|uniref:Gfo/Idh/MocA family protein n=1 Tax=Martelella mediterranea TaxID=293089 RepID=UPI001E362423|nr:Gfo/Idh/MocA family oxidoreductase [Martelella mediterranea]MCD1632623.1 Gfo/Idh/MocA family oxidoreductase [Martelella mediterranea]
MLKDVKPQIRIGVVGCGNISKAYLHNAAMFPAIRPVACADLNSSVAKARADAFGIRAVDYDEMLASSEIDLILNLTVPTAHFDVSMQALQAGKHVFTEKPLSATFAEGRRLVDEARARDLLIGSAPDTFLGAAGRYARQQIETGVIGRVVSGTAFMMGRGMEHWHPDPTFYYQPGGGPVLDMGPYYLTMLVNLLGPVRRVQATATSAYTERFVSAEGPLKGKSIPVNTPTTVAALLEFDKGAQITFVASWDVFRHSGRQIELHGTEGSLGLPDPDNFSGVVSLSRLGAPWQDVDTATMSFGALNWPLDAPDRGNYRMLGLADMAQALVEGRNPRASGALALHVLDVMQAILCAGETGEAVAVDPVDCQPAILDEAEAEGLLA